MSPNDPQLPVQLTDVHVHHEGPLVVLDENELPRRVVALYPEFPPTTPHPPLEQEIVPGEPIAPAVAGQKYTGPYQTTRLPSAITASGSSYAVGSSRGFASRTTRSAA